MDQHSQDEANSAEVLVPPPLAAGTRPLDHEDLDMEVEEVPVIEPGVELNKETLDASVPEEVEQVLAEIKNATRRLHANLGHPSREVMLRLLRLSNAPPTGGAPCALGELSRAW